MISSSIRTRYNAPWSGESLDSTMIVTVLSVLLEHMLGLTAGLMTHILCGEDRADASTVMTVLNGWVSGSNILTPPSIPTHSKRTSHSLLAVLPRLGRLRPVNVALASVS